MAAPDASRAADSYIGSFISLTSKSEIRYEGVLCNINTDESNIGLRNVRSYGTEGRKKDGPQVPPSDKVYEYILFRGSDIKDLQVKSSPPVQPTPTVHNDPAIIQSHYPHSASSQTGLPSNDITYVPDANPQTGQKTLPRTAFQGGLPLYQPPGGLNYWGSSPAPPNTDGSGPGVPMYWQGYYASGSHSQLQQPQIPHPPGLHMPPSLQQSVQYPGIASAPMPPLSANLFGMDASFPPEMLKLPVENSPIPTVASSFPRPSSPFLSSAASLYSTGLPSTIPSIQATNLDSEISLPPSSSTRFASGLPEQVAPASLPPNPSFPKSDMDFFPNKTTPTLGPNVSYQAIVQAMPTGTIALSSSSQDELLAPALVTPAQLLHGSSSISSSQLLQSTPKEAEKKLKEVEYSEELSTESRDDRIKLIDPIPIKPDQKVPPFVYQTNVAPMHAAYNYHHNRGRGRGRGRGNELARAPTKFTEDFDFNAMNEKFNKEEIWGHLGKSKGLSRERDKEQDEYGENITFEEYAAGSSKADAKPVYVKNDFFDTLSCNSFEHTNRFSRGRFSGQRRMDYEMHDFQRHYGSRGGGRGFRGGPTRGPFSGRGNGYAGHGRDYSSTYRA